MTAPFDPENDVERLLLDATADPQAMRAFLQALAAGEAWVPGRAGDTLSVAVREAPDGRRFVPVYTSEARMAAVVPDGTSFVRLPMAALLDALEPDAWLGVNAGVPAGLLLPANDVRAASGAARVEEGTAYAIGEPAEEPRELLDDLRAWFAEDRPGVARAWRALVVMDPSGGGRPEPLVGLELEPGVEADSVFEAAVRRLERHGHGPVMLVPVDPAAPAGTAAWLLEHTQPFWDS